MVIKIEYFIATFIKRIKMLTYIIFAKVQVLVTELVLFYIKYKSVAG